MLRIADEVSIRLRDGEEPDKVRGSYRSQSQVSEGFRLYINEQEKKIRETRADLATAEEELEQTNSTCDRVQREKKELIKDVESLSSEKALLQKDVGDKRVELESLREGVEVLRKRGFTQNIVTRLKRLNG